MLKGHATIDLHDTVRGTYKRYEQDNLVTNAYKYHLASTILMSAETAATYPLVGENGALALCDVALAGLMMFDGSLEEDADNVRFPGDVHLAGYADRTTDTANPMRGSYNSLESKKTDRGFMSVWDFTTAQCNGPIASLSLTNIRAGADPIGYTLNKNWAATNTGRMAYDYHDGVYGYYFGIDGKNATIAKSYQPQTQISVKTYSFAGSTVANFTVDMSGDSAAITNRALWQYAGEGSFYAAKVKADNNKTDKSLTIQVAKIHTDDWEHFEYTPVREITLAGVTGKADNLGTIPVVSGHYVYVPEYPTGTSGNNAIKKVFIADLDNPADVKEVSFPNGIHNFVYGMTYARDFRTNYPTFDGGADFWEYVTNGSFYRIHVYPDGRFVKAATTSNTLIRRGFSKYNAPCRAWFGTGTGSHSGVYPVINYLGTICNLGRPIEKTSAQTMKVTYTLTDV